MTIAGSNVQSGRRLICSAVLAAVGLLSGCSSRDGNYAAQHRALGGAIPRFNEVMQKSTHNAYWVTRDSAPGVDPGAAGTQMRLWDQLMHEHVRSLEWDLHWDMDDPIAQLRKHPGEFRVYHTNDPSNSTCFLLEDCLQLLQRLDYVDPNHEVVHIALELKQVDSFADDQGLFDSQLIGGHQYNPAEIDRVLWEHLGSRLYTPAEFMSATGCENATTLRDCARTAQWPTIDELRGRYIVTVHGTETPFAPGACNERAWWEYASTDIRRHAAFPMFVVSNDVSDADMPVFKAQRYNTNTQDFVNMWRTSLDNTIFWQLEDWNNSDFTSTTPIQSAYHGVVRTTAAHLVDHDVPAGAREDDVGRIRQDFAVQQGWNLIMTDYPANFISDFRSTASPTIPSRVNRPFFEAFDVQLADSRSYDPDAFLEPANRIYFDTENRILDEDLLPTTPGPYTTTNDPQKLGALQMLRTAPSRDQEPIEDWEAFPATSMGGHGDGPRENTPFGFGCLRVSTIANEWKAADEVRICREPHADNTRSVTITVDVIGGGNFLHQSDTLENHIIQGATLGEAIRARVDRSGAGTTVALFTASEVNPDGSMRWIPYNNGPWHFDSDMSVQGLLQAGAGVFVGTRLNGQPLSFAELSPGSTYPIGDPPQGYAYDLSYCGSDGSACQPRTFDHTETVTMNGVPLTKVHQVHGQIYGGQDRHLYTTDHYEALTSGMPEYVDTKFLVAPNQLDANWVPLYRCVDWRRDMHVYWLSTSAACANSGDDPGHPNGILGFISTVPDGPVPLVPLYHYRKGTDNATGAGTSTPEHDTHDHYFAVGASDRAFASQAGYSYFEFIGYVPFTAVASARANSSVSPSPGPYGWIGSDSLSSANTDHVTLTLSSASPLVSGGAPFKEFDYVMQGAQTLGQTASAANPTAIAISTDGSTDVRYYAVDTAGNQEFDQTATVRLDRIPPSVAGTISPPSNCAISASPCVGWNRTPVTASFNCSDRPSGVLSCPPGTTFTTEGRNQSVSGTGSDYALNKTTATITVNIDWTPPTVGYSGNAGSYTIDQTVDITCFATDALSGVATSTCMPITGPAYTFVIGANSYSFTAMDFADNSASASTAFNVIVTAPSLCHLTDMFSGDAGAANGLCAKIYAVASAPNAIDKEGKLIAFDNQVNAQIGNALTSEQASILKRLILYL